MSQTLPEKKRETTPEARTSTDIDTIVDRMRRFLDESFAGFPHWPVFQYGDVWTPPVDLEETDDKYVLEAELPGVDSKDIQVELIGNELTVTGEVKEKERAGVLRRQARRRGQFSYWIALPEPVDEDNIDASLKDGVLKVKIPKAEPAERRKIEVKS